MQPTVPSFWTTEIVPVLHDAKFWALVTSLVGIVVGIQTATLTVPQAEPLAVAALAAYALGGAIVAHGVAMGNAAPMVVTVNNTTPTAVGAVPQGVMTTGVNKSGSSSTGSVVVTPAPLVPT